MQQKSFGRVPFNLWGPRDNQKFGNSTKKGTKNR